ncbi:hypothetical protein O6H91_16G085200 [Diphasiastrum complanatum]|uniref:Uncharacterized protein n=1 Tax=Diphasiastrum complanatum TaxID=34168 RepID=A0ACC2BEI7_DIPCM|nr:hypothetical protein O6H91_16G085200 [Diphasiastrum complanatum]
MPYMPAKRRREEYEYMKVDMLGVNTKLTSTIEVIVGDVNMVREGLSHGDNLQEYQAMKCFMERNNSSRRIRKDKSTTYSADIIIVDLPSGYTIDGVVGDGSTWNKWSDETLEASLDICMVVLDDSGWIILICPPTHRLQVEIQIDRQKLAIQRRVVLRGIDEESPQIFSPRRSQRERSKPRRLTYGIQLH